MNPHNLHLDTSDPVLAYDDLHLRKLTTLEWFLIELLEVRQLHNADANLHLDNKFFQTHTTHQFI